MVSPVCLLSGKSMSILLFVVSDSYRLALRTFVSMFSSIVDSLCACALSLVGTDTYCVKIKCGTGYSQ